MSTFELTLEVAESQPCCFELQPVDTVAEVYLCPPSLRQLVLQESSSAIETCVSQNSDPLDRARDSHQGSDRRTCRETRTMAWDALMF